MVTAGSGILHGQDRVRKSGFYYFYVVMREGTAESISDGVCYCPF